MKLMPLMGYLTLPGMNVAGGVIHYGVASYQHQEPYPAFYSYWGDVMMYYCHYTKRNYGMSPK
jgi:hypothetical protein